jgi:TolB protein
MRRAFLAVAASLVAIGGVSAIPAGATAPGKNGDITFRRFIDGVGVLFTIHPDGTGERRVLTPPEGSTDDFPDFASDGSLIAFQRCADLCQVMVVRPDGSGLRRVGTNDDNSDIALSPDVRRVAFTRFSGAVQNDEVEHADIYTARLSGGGLRRITRAPRFTASDSQVQWSPDGRRLLFTRKFVEGKQAIYVINADGSHLRRVTRFELQAGDWPDWSPDGKRILFRSPEPGEFLNSNLFTIRPDGSGLRQITHQPPDTTVFSASFSPDGKSITAGLQGVGGAADIFTMRADGSHITPVTRTPERDSAPDWGGRR